MLGHADPRTTSIYAHIGDRWENNPGANVEKELKTKNEAFRQIEFTVLVKFYRFLILIFLTTVVIFITSNSTAQNINYLQQGRQYYDRGQYSEAVQLWQQAAERDKEIENKILGYNYLAIAYQDLERWEQSAKAIDTAFGLLETIDNSFYMLKF